MINDPPAIALSTDNLSADSLSADASSAEATIALLIDSLTAVPEYTSPFIPIYEALGTSTESALSTSASSAQAVTKLPKYSAQALSRPPRLHGGKLLTLRALRTHSHLLRDCSDLARDQTAAIHQVIVSCKQIFPTPLPALPLGF